MGTLAIIGTTHVDSGRGHKIAILMITHASGSMLFMTMLADENQLGT